MDVSRDIYRPLRAGLFFYECLRLLLLVVFLFVTTMGNGLSVRGFPYLVYLSSNALFPLMVLFVWLKPDEYFSYLSLYVSGKIIALVTFYLWQIFSSQGFWEAENLVMSTFLLWGSVIVGLTDMLSLLGAWTLKNKIRRDLPRVPGRPLGSVSGAVNGYKKGGFE